MFTWLKHFVLVVGVLMAGASAWAVDVNNATATQLQEIKGIGPVVAERIVKERRKGKFESWADLQDRVKGIADGKSKQFSKAGLTVGSASYKGLKAKKKTTKKATTTSKSKAASAKTKEKKSTINAKDAKSGKAKQTKKSTLDKKSKSGKKAKSNKKKTSKKESKKLRKPSKKKAQKTNK